MDVLTTLVIDHRQSRWLDMGTAQSGCWEPPQRRQLLVKQLQLVYLAIRFFLALNILANHVFVYTNR